MDDSVRAAQVDAAWRQHRATRTEVEPGGWERGTIKMFGASFGFIRSERDDEVFLSGTDLRYLVPA
jgi:hypothetical protein